MRILFTKSIILIIFLLTITSSDQVMTVTKQSLFRNYLKYSANVSIPYCGDENLMNVLGWCGHWVEAEKDEILQWGRVCL